MDAAKTKLNVKLTQLELSVKKSASILEKGNEEAIERHLNGLKVIISEVDQCKRTVEELQIAEEIDVKEITQFGSSVDEKVEAADVEVTRIKRWLQERIAERDAADKEGKMQFEMKLHQLKLDAQSASNQKNDNNAENVNAKLPKIEIARFDGSPLDWPRFWGQFIETVDKRSVAPVNKFAYLCGFLSPKVKTVIEGLPFTPEGYNRAKSILEERYGKNSEVIKAYVKLIMDLPTINHVNLKKIHQFNDQLIHAVQALQTLKKLETVNGYVPMILDKLQAIRGDLVRTDPDWEDWDFAKLSEALRLWTRRNPIVETNESDENKSSNQNRSRRLFFSKGPERACVYCEGGDHKTASCSKITDVSTRREILAKKRLCFNCAAGNHKAANCPSKRSCQNCEKRHHTSICDTNSKVNLMGMTSKTGIEAIFPVVVVKINGIKCRALIDSGAGSSYASAKLVNALKLKPTETKTSRIDMLMTSQVTQLEIYKVKVQALDSDYELETNLTKVNKSEILVVDNPQYMNLLLKYQHLKEVKLNETETKKSLPIHVVLGSGEYARIKTQERPRIGNEGEPIAELTKLGWFVMSPGTEFDEVKMMLTQTSQTDYEALCRLDVLGLEDKSEHDQFAVYDEFKEQLIRAPEGWYETGLPWKGNHPLLKDNRDGSLRRLTALQNRLKKRELTEHYTAVIEDQIQQGIVEEAPKLAKGVEFYIPHKEVIRESAATTKLRVVYDASAKPSPQDPSLNDCLYAGPPLQNKMGEVLVRQRSFPVALTGDIVKAFLQIRIRETERDALRFHWKTNSGELQILRFTRALFGLVSSPFLLGGVIASHLERWKHDRPEDVKELERCLYVDDIISGGETVEQAKERKEAATIIFEDATFKLHKWASNVCALEENSEESEVVEDQTAAKRQLGVNPQESKILGLPWNKANDTLSVLFPRESKTSTKREILSKLAKIYDPLGLVSPVTLQGKMIFREICDAKLPWDAEIQGNIRKRWESWEKSTPSAVTVSRPIARYRESIKEISLHAFGDASSQGVSAAVYGVSKQESGETQSLIAAKSRLAKRGLTIPRLELIAGHMAVNLVTNVAKAIGEDKITEQHCWLDSTVALYWIEGVGEYRQFVANRVAKVRSHTSVKWHHVPTDQNPADLGSRGGQLTDLWLNGPQWLGNPENWPESPIIQPSKESQAEAKIVREVFCAARTKNESDDLDLVLERNDLRRTLRVTAWLLRFVNNCKKREKRNGPLNTAEVQEAERWWIKRVQQREINTPNFTQTKEVLNLKENEEGVLVCHGRIQGAYPVYLPTNASFTRKLIRKIHVNTLHGGIGLTIAAVRETYWIPKLRQLVKAVRSECWGCKRFRAVAIKTPAPGYLPKNRTVGETAFEVVGVDFAGPIRYKKSKNESKAYLVIFACSLSRAIYLELLPDLTTDTFIPCLKRFIARRGRPRVIYSDNGGTFVKAAKWLKKILKDERFHNHLEQNDIKWIFNLSRAPWWGGQYERLIGVVKSAMRKVIGKGILYWNELSEVLLDVETQVNRRPLSYVENDVELPVLTPTSFQFQRANQLPEAQPHDEEDKDLRRRLKFLKNCKDQLWNRWRREYLTALRERHNMITGSKSFGVRIGDVVIVQTDEKNRGCWPLAVVTEIFPGKDGVTRAVKIRTENGELERPVQHLYPLELSCNVQKEKKERYELNPQVPTFRQRRDASVAADARIQQTMELDQREI